MLLLGFETSATGAAEVSCFGSGVGAGFSEESEWSAFSSLGLVSRSGDAGEAGWAVEDSVLGASDVEEESDDSEFDGDGSEDGDEGIVVAGSSSTPPFDDGAVGSVVCGD